MSWLRDSLITIEEEKNDRNKQVQAPTQQKVFQSLSYPNCAVVFQLLSGAE